MDSAVRPEAWSALRTASAAARHQSRGSCSAQPGCGLAKLACSSVPEARTAPWSSTMTARVPLVPTSMPRIGIQPPSYARKLRKLVIRKALRDVGSSALGRGTKCSQEAVEKTLQKDSVNVHGGHLRLAAGACQRDSLDFDVAA